MRYKGILANLTIFVVSIIIFLFIAEIFTRTFWDQGYSHKYDWRDRTEGYTFKKEKGTYRILVLGDSVTYGQGVKREETYPKLIENLLNENNENNAIKKYEVINLAWPGVNTAAEFYLLRNKGLKYNPDLILVGYFLNDVGPPPNTLLDPTYPFYIRRALNRPGMAYAIPIPEMIDENLTLYSDFYMFLLTKYDQLIKRFGYRNKISGDADINKSYADYSEAWATNIDFLARIYSLGKENNARPFLVILPHMHNLSKYSFGWIHNKVKKVSEDIGYPTLDLLPYFEGKKSKEFVVSKIDSHPNDKAHKIMAQQLYQFIITEKLITQQ